MTQVQTSSVPTGDNQRNEGGFALVEMLVACVCLSFFMIGVLDAMSCAQRQCTAAQNQLLAANIAQQLCDAARNQNWATLQANLGTKTLSGLYINRTVGSSLNNGIAYFPRPMVLDIANNTYSGQTWNGQAGAGNLFNGTVTQTIASIDANTVNVLVLVSWPSDRGGTNNLTQSTVISQYGIHNF